MNSVLPIYQYLDRLGAPVERFMHQAKLSPDLLNSPDTAIPLELVYHFVEIAIQREGLPHLGLTLGLETPLDALGYYGRVIQESRTVYEYLNKAIALQGLQHSSNWYWMSEHGDELRIYCRSTGNSVVGRYQAELLTLILTIKQLRKASNGTWSPTKLRLAQKGEKLPDIALFENTRISMGAGESYISLPRALLQRTFEFRDCKPAVVDDTPLQELPQGLPAALRQAMEVLLPVSNPNIEQVAEVTGQSVRTLERALAKQQLTFSGIKADTRMQLASEWLKDDALSIKHIAYTLGYLDPSNFTRAFRRRAGISPWAYRQQHT